MTTQPAGAAQEAAAAYRRLANDALARSIVGTVFGVFAPAFVTPFFLEGSYAGASSSSVTERAASQYAGFLDRVLSHLLLVGLFEVLLLWGPVLGLCLLAIRLRTRALRWPVYLAVGLAVSLLFFAWMAWQAPGLFLTILSRSTALTLLVGTARWLAPVFLGASVLGSAWATLQASWRARFVIGATLVVPVAGLAIASRQLPGRIYGAPQLSGVEKPATDRPNVLVVAVDSLRPDKIDKAATPNLARLVEESIYFPNTLVTVPRTGPSWTSALTSLPPLANGVETMFPTARLGNVENFALPAHLGALGYRTAVFSEYAGEFFGRARFGFQVSSVPRVELREIAGQIAMARAPTLLAGAGLLYTRGPMGRRILDEPLVTLLRGMASFAHPAVLTEDVTAVRATDVRAAGQTESHQIAPYFFLVFYSQPHFPYTSSAEFHTRYAVPGASSAIRFGRDATSETPITSDEDKLQIEGLYRAALAETDASVGKLLARLESSGELADTIVVLAADHGEGLYECRTCVGHGDNLTGNVTLRVPLAFRLPKIRYPGVTPRVVDEWASELDIYPTVLSLLGEPPIAVHEGKALLSPKGETTAPVPRTFFAETGEWLWQTAALPRDRIEYPPITRIASLENDRIVIDEKYLPEIRAAKHRAVVRPPYKLTYEPSKSGAAYHLYRIDRDPNDEHDLAAEETPVLDALKAALRANMVRDPKILPVGDYFLTRPAMPLEESW